MTKTEHLVAAYADDGLTPDQTAQVSDYLAQHPQASGQARELRALCEELRAAATRPATEPAWPDMARSIRTAIATRPRWFSRLAQLCSTRPARSVLATAAVAALGLAVLVLQPNPERANRDDSPLTAQALERELGIALPTVAEMWRRQDIVFELDMQEEITDETTHDATHDDDEHDIDFLVAPTLSPWIDQLDAAELSAVEAELDEGTPS